MAHPGGRPTKYDENVVTDTLKYIESCEDEFIEFHKTRGEKSDSFERLVNVNIPTIEELSEVLKVTISTTQEWRKKYPEFSAVIEVLLAKQARMLLRGGLSGTYNPTISKVLLAKHGYRDAVDTDVTSAGEKISSINYIVPTNHGDNAETDNQTASGV